MKSIRSRLVSSLLALLGPLSLAGGGLACWTMSRAMISEFDYSLATKAHNFAAMTEINKNNYEFEFIEKNMFEFERSDHPEYFQVIHLGKGVIARSPSLGKFELEPPPVPLPATPIVYPVQLPESFYSQDH